jgi:hypothetical protein
VILVVQAAVLLAGAAYPLYDVATNARGKRKAGGGVTGEKDFFGRLWDSMAGTTPAASASSASSAAAAAASAGSQTTQAAAAPPAPDATVELSKSPKVPGKCQEKAAAILAQIEVLAPRLATRGPADAYVVEVSRLRHIHLAELLQRYIDIPEEHRAEIFRRTQKSASFHLAASLDVMAARLAEISRIQAQGILDQFTDSTRFVDDHYGQANDPFA